VHSHLFNLEPATFEFLENVLDEVLQLFPSHFIHIGGDEAVKDEWNASAAVQARARSWHPRCGRFADLFHPENRSIFACSRQARGRWDEDHAPGLSSGAVVMAWHGAKAAHAAAIRGNDTVLAPAPEMYSTIGKAACDRTAVASRQFARERVSF